MTAVPIDFYATNFDFDFEATIRPRLHCIRSLVDLLQKLKSEQLAVYTHASDPKQNLFG